MLVNKTYCGDISHNNHVVQKLLYRYMSTISQFEKCFQPLRSTKYVQYFGVI